jgi:hypothetical protein
MRHATRIALRGLACPHSSSYPTPLARAKSGQAWKPTGGSPTRSAHRRPAAPGAFKENKGPLGSHSARPAYHGYIIHHGRPQPGDASSTSALEPRATSASNTSLVDIPAGPRPPRISPWAPLPSSSIPRPPALLAAQPVANRSHVSPSPAWLTWPTTCWRNPC